MVAWVSGQEWFLLVPFIAGLMGLLFGFNPIIQIGKLFLRKNPKDYIPEDWEQQQFNQKIAVTCLGLGFVSFSGRMECWRLCLYDSRCRCRICCHSRFLHWLLHSFSMETISISQDTLIRCQIRCQYRLWTTSGICLFQKIRSLKLLNLDNCLAPAPSD